MTSSTSTPTESSREPRIVAIVLVFFLSVRRPPCTIAAGTGLSLHHRAHPRIEGETLVLLDLFFLSLSLWFSLVPSAEPPPPP